MATRMHTGVELSYLVGRVEELGDRQEIVKMDGKPLSGADALVWLGREIAAGKRIASSCPTPEPDGACRGHKE